MKNEEFATAMNGKCYRVNDIFYSLQGEGRNTGRAAAFVRFAGCNLRCSFCDTEFESYREMTGEEILQAISSFPSRFVVLTGGEPTLQVDELLIDQLHQHGYEVAMESNGTRPAPSNLDWLTISPKTQPKQLRCNELKLVFTSAEQVDTHGIEADYYYLQPCDTGDRQQNALLMKACVEYIEQHPMWRLSLQTHKLIDIK